jgi:hypothetical protein
MKNFTNKIFKKLQQFILPFSLTFWLGYSLLLPIFILFKNDEPTTFDYVFGLNTVIILFFFSKSVIPKALKNFHGTDNLGSTKTNPKKNSGCSSCKKKNKKIK